MSDSIGSHDPSENSWSEYIKETLLPSITVSSINERTQLLHLLLVRVKRKGMDQRPCANRLHPTATKIIGEESK
jgi:hypothetical protein